MLVLTRKIGERLVINDNIIINVVEVKGESVRIAIEAPKEIKIYRGEIYDAIVAENRQAAAHNDLTNLAPFGEMLVSRKNSKQLQNGDNGSESAKNDEN